MVDFKRLLEEHRKRTPEEREAHSEALQKWVESKMIELMPFGKYKGERLSDIPTDYIEWALSTWEYSDRNKELMTELANQLALRRGDGVVRSKEYVDQHKNKI